ncbi:2036_t:CDS:1 [Paraglomus occultum]|uniref:2036_t:CDS:1 n=1 Tax=Paraglomus occultum TaxID=144539 RepID=A0A9N9AHN8_9GLOM|nr:2036_t:CDS:1 [Paraglomus occultum]
MKSVYLLILLVALVFDYTSANAIPLEKRNTKPPCCPISNCVFKAGDNPLQVPGFAGNTFNGSLTFMQSPVDTLQIVGWLNVLNAPSGPAGNNFDIHVGNCRTATNRTPGDPHAVIDLDSQGFDTPILTSKKLPISAIANQCCFVVNETKTTPPTPEQLLGVVPVTTVLSCI